jgi:serine/threonine protein kinase
VTDGFGYTGPATSPDDYEVVELLKTGGGQGHVFRAVLRSDRIGSRLVDAEVALKQLSTGAVGADRSEELNNIMRTRRHPQLARHLEVFRGPAPRPAGEPFDDADLLYVVSVWVPGTPLITIAASATLDQLITWNRQIGEALDYLHAEVHDEGPVVHRDVKPANIIITPSSNAVLIDPGLARLTVAEATGTPWGSPGYIPPETLDPTAGGPASDRWQLAATLVAALLGEPPGTRPNLPNLRQRLIQRLGGEVADPAALADRILSMLAADPTERPPSASGWAAALGALAAGGTRHARRTGTLVALGVGVVLVGASLALAALTGGDGSEKGGNTTSVEPAELTVAAVIDNRVTNAASMREDTPAYLSEVTENFCRPNGCDIPSTDLVSGDEITLVCQTLGQRTTNGDDTNTNDDSNTERYESRLWYYAIHENGNEGYISEVWIEDDYRGGMDLPLC